MIELLQLGNTNRVVGATDLNHASSRSHAILVLEIIKNTEGCPELQS